MAGEPVDLMARVDGLLASGALQPAPRALLLLKLCQVAGVLSPQKAELYWQQLKDQTGSLPREFNPDLEAVRQMFEVEAASTDKFVVGKVAERQVFGGIAPANHRSEVKTVGQEHRLEGR